MSLQDKAVDIKGKKYVMVKDRVLYFHEHYSNGSIETMYTRVGDTYEFVARITPDVSNKERVFTGHSSETIGDGYINATSAMENAETSAVGRAFAMMGVGVIDSIASVDEINKAENARKAKKNTPTPIEGIAESIGMDLEEAKAKLRMCGIDTVGKYNALKDEGIIKLLKGEE